MCSLADDGMSRKDMLAQTRLLGYLWRVVFVDIVVHWCRVADKLDIGNTKVRHGFSGHSSVRPCAIREMTMALARDCNAEPTRQFRLVCESSKRGFYT